MEGLDFVTLYVALTPSQAEAVLNGLGAMPEESSNRFGLRTSKMAAVQRSQYFHEWEHRYGFGQTPGLTHTQGVCSGHREDFLIWFCFQDVWGGPSKDESGRVSLAWRPAVERDSSRWKDPV